MRSKSAKFIYDLSALYYNDLRKLFFPELKAFTIQAIDAIPIGEYSNVLIVGGGTGDILPHVFQRFSESSIHYVDISSAMIKRAKKYAYKNVVYHCKDIFEFSTNLSFQLILVPFFLDHFNRDELFILTQKFKNVSENGTVITCVDFSSTNKSSKLAFILSLAKIPLGLKIARVQDSQKAFELEFPVCIQEHRSSDSLYTFWIRKMSS